MSQDESKARWWSYVPDFPKPAILLLAFLVDTVILGTYWHNYCCGPFADKIMNGTIQWNAAIINVNPMANVAAILALAQLNTEVGYMILTKKRIQNEKREAVAAAIEATEAKTKAEERAKAQAWFEQYQANPDTAPPPPWQANGADPGP